MRSQNPNGQLLCAKFTTHQLNTQNKNMTQTGCKQKRPAIQNHIAQHHAKQKQTENHSKTFFCFRMSLCQKRYTPFDKIDHLQLGILLQNTTQSKRK